MIDMQVADLLKKDVMLLNLKATSKEAAIDEMIANLYKYRIISEQESFKKSNSGPRGTILNRVR